MGLAPYSNGIYMELHGIAKYTMLYIYRDPYLIPNKYLSYIQLSDYSKYEQHLMPKPESSIELELRNMRQMGCMKPRMRAAGFEGSQTSISKEQFPPYTLYTRLF